jgi:hypothetical protein
VGGKHSLKLGCKSICSQPLRVFKIRLNLDPLSYVKLIDCKKNVIQKKDPTLKNMSNMLIYTTNCHPTVVSTPQTPDRCLALVPPVSHAHSVARVAHAHRPPLLARQRRRTRPTVGGHCWPSRVADHRASPPLLLLSPPRGRDHADPPFSSLLCATEPLFKSTCHRPVPVSPVLLSSTP